MLSPLTFSGKKSSLQISPLTGFSNEDLQGSSFLFATHQEENTVENVALALEFAELEDAPLYRSFGGRGVSKSSDDMLVAARGYREAEQKPNPLRANRCMDDVFPLRKREPSQPSLCIPRSFEQDADAALWSTTAQRGSPTYSPEGWNGEKIDYFDIGSSISSTCTPPDESATEFATPNLPLEPLPQTAIYHVSRQNRVEVSSFLTDHISASKTLSPSHLLIIDVDTPDIKGSVITTLARTTRSSQGIRGPDGTIYTGESILVPELHDPRGMVRYLLESGNIKFSSLQPCVSKLLASEERTTACGQQISTSILDEARLFALRNRWNPTLAKCKATRNELVWCGWNLLLNPGLKHEKLGDEGRRRGVGSLVDRDWDLEVGMRD